MNIRAAVTGQPADEGLDLPVADRWVQRRVGFIWGLLFLNVLPYQGGGAGLVIPIGQSGGQLVTTAALVTALLLAVSLNRRLEVRPNVVLTLGTLLACSALATGLLLEVGKGGALRPLRFIGFLAVLWLLTPWWGRRDLLIARSHLWALVVVSSSVLLGALIHPSLALGRGSGKHRLVGVVWPIPSPQVAEYAALVAGMAIMLWLSGRMPRTPAFLLAGVGGAMVIATQTRTALTGAVAGVACGAATLFLTRARVRRLALVFLVVVPIAAVLLFPAFSHWFNRGQSSADRASLTGRKQVWDALVSAPRPEFNRWFGYGLGNKSFNGLSIDSTWLAVYHDEGLVGLGLVTATFVLLLVAPFYRRAGPARAVATFLVVYCLVASYTEVGLGDASPYWLTIVAAASLVTPGRRRGALASA